MGFEPTTFCMASRRSSQLSYSRAERHMIAARNWAESHPSVLGQAMSSMATSRERYVSIARRSRVARVTRCSAAAAPTSAS
jgi:hypothetical protein